MFIVFFVSLLSSSSISERHSLNHRISRQNNTVGHASHLGVCWDPVSGPVLMRWLLWFWLMQPTSPVQREVGGGLHFSNSLDSTFVWSIFASPTHAAKWVSFSTCETQVITLHGVSRSIISKASCFDFFQSCSLDLGILTQVQTWDWAFFQQNKVSFLQAGALSNNPGFFFFPWTAAVAVGYGLTLGLHMPVISLICCETCVCF